ncbi:MAG TPA: glycosyltransferase family 39 protein, partial [Anaerolineae bacterium]|nr:glycosyltransferase family 39 protein [Anaerolineae bacterium]
MKRTYRVGFILVLIGYVCLAVVYSLVNPLFESPDESNHYDFVRYLIAHHELPVQTLGKLTEYFEPPLYYAISAVLIGGVPVEAYTPRVNPFFGYEAYRFGIDNKALYIHSAQEAFPYQGTALAVHLLRGFSILLGALSLIVSFRALSEVFKRPAMALGAIAFIAFNPQFLLISSSVSNDNLIILLSVLMTWLAIRIAQSGITQQRTLIMAALAAAAVLTKLSAALLILVFLAALFVARTPWRKWLSTLTISGAAGLVLTGWWFLRNMGLYGEPTGIRMWQQIWGWENVAVSSSDLGVALQNLWTSYWGRFGWGQIVLPYEVYGILLIIGLLSLIGLARNLYAWRQRTHSPAGEVDLPDADPRGLGILLLTLGLVLGASIWYGLVNPAGTAGRFWFPAIMPLGGLMFYGLRGLYRPRQTQLDKWFIGGVYGSMIALGVGSLIGVIAPAYAAPAPVSLDEVRRQTRSVDIRFRDAAQLLGYALDRDRLTAGEELQVTLCWQTVQPTSADLYFFLHLLGANNTIVARRESLPGLGRYPSTQWAPNRIFCDNVPLHVEESTAGSKVYDLEVGLVDLASGSRLPAMNTAGVELQPAILRRIKVRTSQPGSAAPAGTAGVVQLGGQFRLIDSEVLPAAIKAGDTLSVTLVWQAVQVPVADYTVFVHVRDAGDHTVAQADRPPQAGAYPTSFWDVDETVVDEHLLPLPAALPAGDYTV